MKKILLFAFVVMLSGAAYAACVAELKTYTSCKPGYYLVNGMCLSCPQGGLSGDKNSEGISACYLPQGATGDDITGYYEIVDGTCPYFRGS